MNRISVITGLVFILCVFPCRAAKTSGIQIDLHSLEKKAVAPPDSLDSEKHATSQSLLRIEDVPPGVRHSLTQFLQGRIPGLMIRHNSGQPGYFDADLSIWGNNTPLLVIDGVICHDITTLNMINPNDISTVRVLKNNAAVVYGGWGTNGVIEISTENGRRGRPEINFQSSVGVQNPVALARMADAYQYAVMVNRARSFQQLDPLYDSVMLDAYRRGLQGYKGTNWFNEVFKRNTMLQSHTLSVDGGTAKLDYYVSLGLQEDKGILKSRDLGYELYRFRTNFSFRPLRGLEMRLNVEGIQGKTYEPITAFRQIYKSAMYAQPTEDIYTNGERELLRRVLPFEINPMASSDAEIFGQNNKVHKDFRTAVSVSYEIPFLNGLFLEGRYATDISQMDMSGKSQPNYLYNYDEISGEYDSSRHYSAELINDFQDYLQDNYRLQARFNSRTVGMHHLEVVFGIEADRYDVDRETTSTGYADNQGRIVFLDTSMYSHFTNQEDRRSLYGSVEYNLLGRYIVESAFRVDRNPLEPTMDQRRDSYMAAAAWNVSEEAFFQKMQNVISSARLFVSFGKTEGKIYKQLFPETSSWYSPVVTAVNSEIGIESVLLNNQMMVKMVLFQKKRLGIHRDRVVTTPGSPPEEEVIQPSDLLKGFETEISINKNVGNISLCMSINLAFVRHMLLQFDVNQYKNSYDRWRYGRSYRYADVLWGYELEGQFTDAEEILHAPPQNRNRGNEAELPGDYRYKDLNGDGVINEQDMQPLFMDETPKLHYGLIFKAQWRNFDFSLLMQGAGKYTRSLNDGYLLFIHRAGNVPATYYDAWTIEENQNYQSGKWPVTRYIGDVGAMYRPNRIWTRNASYLRVKNLTMGYSIAKNWLKRFRIEKIRFTASGHNLFTIADELIREIDPEIKDFYNYPLMKSMNIGFDVTF